MSHESLEPPLNTTSAAAIADAAGELQGLMLRIRQALLAVEKDVATAQALIMTVVPHLPLAGTGAEKVEGPAGPALSAEETRLKLLCLGPFEMRWGAIKLPQPRMGKSSTILKYLASQPRQPVQRDILVELLWPEIPPDVATNRLKVAVHYARQALRSTVVPEEVQNCLVAREGCYLFNTAVTVWSDVEDFEAGWRAGLRLEQAGRWDEAAHAYTEAWRLYRGDFLEEDRYEEWTLLRREELKDMYLNLLGKLGHYALRHGDVEGALEHWKAILAKDPLREDVYRLLMLQLARRGQRAQALHWYGVCVQVLQEEIGIEPERETAALADRIRLGASLDALDAQGTPD